MSNKMSDIMRQIAHKVEIAERDEVVVKRIEIWYDTHNERYRVEWTAKNQKLDKPINLEP